MGERIPTRLGDGSLVEMSAAEIEADLLAGSDAAVRRAKVPPLEPDEIEHLLEIFTSRAHFSSVDYGDEVVLSFDGAGNADAGLPVTEQIMYQNHHGADSIELWHHDYSYKAVKTVLSFQTQMLKDAQLQTVVPLNYGAMPDLGRYSRPDGPCPNWSELMPLGDIAGAREAQEEAVEHLERDMYVVAEAMIAAGADGLDFDTAGAAGDADLLATLRVVRRIRENWPDIGIEVGQAAELVLGMHGELEFDGCRLAGMWPVDQLRAVTAAGATIFGPAVNVNTTKSLPWNTARACALVKPVTAEATIPVHMNAGMGVGGVPMTAYPPVDATSRASRALVDIAKIDGLQVGVGDPLGMASTHALASGMGGMRTAGDLVARMQITRGMRLTQAKQYVADKLGCSVLDLSDTVAMHDIRRDLGLGRIIVQDLTYPEHPGAMEAKFHIAETLDVPVNSVERFKQHAGIA